MPAVRVLQLLLVEATPRVTVLLRSLYEFRLLVQRYEGTRTHARTHRDDAVQDKTQHDKLIAITCVTASSCSSLYTAVKNRAFAGRTRIYAPEYAFSRGERRLKLCGLSQSDT